MNLLVALGNPTKKYESTRHNVGFMALDYYLQESLHNPPLQDKFNSLFVKTHSTIFIKPQTFMNLSGNAVMEVVNYFKPQRILVIHDDLDLPFGALRFKFGGSNGGHNGLKSIDSLIGSEYFRLRIGIGHPRDCAPQMQVAHYVLECFSNEDMNGLKIIFRDINNAIDDFINGTSLLELQNRYTRKIKVSDV